MRFAANQGGRAYPGRVAIKSTREMERALRALAVSRGMSTAECVREILQKALDSAPVHRITGGMKTGEALR